MVLDITLGIIFLVALSGVALFIQDKDVRGLGFVVGALLAAGGMLVSIGFYQLGQSSKTPASLKGQCVANVRLTQYPGRNISAEAQKLRVLLYHNGKCSGNLTFKTVASAR